jgi:hypothetical protein
MSKARFAWTWAWRVALTDLAFSAALGLLLMAFGPPQGPGTEPSYDWRAFYLALHSPLAPFLARRSFNLLFDLAGPFAQASLVFDACILLTEGFCAGLGAYGLALLFHTLRHRPGWSPAYRASVTQWAQGRSPLRMDPRSAVNARQRKIKDQALAALQTALAEGSSVDEWRVARERCLQCLPVFPGDAALLAALGIATLRLEERRVLVPNDDNIAWGRRFLAEAHSRGAADEATLAALLRWQALPPEGLARAAEALAALAPGHSQAAAWRLKEGLVQGLSSMDDALVQMGPELAQDPVMLRCQAEWRYSCGEMGAAVDLLQRLLAIDPEDRSAWRLAQQVLQAPDSPAAAQKFRPGLKLLEPDPARGWLEPQLDRAPSLRWLPGRRTAWSLALFVLLAGSAAGGQAWRLKNAGLPQDWDYVAAIRPNGRRVKFDLNPALRTYDQREEQEMLALLDLREDPTLSLFSDGSAQSSLWPARRLRWALDDKGVNIVVEGGTLPLAVGRLDYDGLALKMPGKVLGLLFQAADRPRSPILDVGDPLASSMPTPDAHGVIWPDDQGSTVPVYVLVNGPAMRKKRMKEGDFAREKADILFWEPKLP